jgi:hypothetical protein
MEDYLKPKQTASVKTGALRKRQVREDEQGIFHQRKKQEQWHCIT